MARKGRISVKRVVFLAAFYAGIILVAGSFVMAKMITQAVITKEAASSVAEWSVEITGASTQSGDDKVSVVVGDEDSQRRQAFNLMVTNNSDTASKYTIKLTGVPTGVMAGLDEGALESPDSDGVVILENTGKELSPHDGRGHTIVFKAQSAAEEVTDHNVSVEVVFTQKEPQ